jgi:hypothetical protein
VRLIPSSSKFLTGAKEIHVDWISAKVVSRRGKPSFGDYFLYITGRGLRKKNTANLVSV